MSEQRQYDQRPDVWLRRLSSADEARASAQRLSATRGELSQLYAAADAILDGIRQSDSERFLEQMRQSGGQ